MSFQQGLSGLNASSKNLEVIGNNVANANTYGAKSSRAEFADMYASAMNGTGGSNIGIGVSLAAVTQQFTQGNITTTANALDLAVNGEGFFEVRGGNGQTVYTRNGQFQVDKNGYIINNEGLQLLGYPADASGTIQPGQASALQLPTAGIEPAATAEISMEMNLDSRAGMTQPRALANQARQEAQTAHATAVAAATAATTASTAATAASTAAAAAAAADPTNTALADAAATAAAAAAAAATALANANDDVTDAAMALASAQAAYTAADAGAQIDFSDASTYNNATSLTVYDAKGQDVALTYFFQKSATDTWNVYVTANGQPMSVDGAGNPLPTTTLSFPSNGGTPTAPAGPLTLDIPASTNAAGAQTLAITSVQFDLRGATQYGASFGVTDLTQDGYAPGQLSGLSIENNGVVMATYSNGQSKPAGQIEMATFRNPQGLTPLGGNVWARTFASGDPIVGTPGQGNLGVLQSGALEESNVDLTGELVNMMMAQRIYQANSQTIKTQDQVMQTLVNLR